MKVIILYRPDSEHDTKVHSYLRDYHAQTGKELDLVSLNTVDGAAMAKRYDIISYPALIALDDHNHSMLKDWQGDELPLINEVSWYDRDDYDKKAFHREIKTIKPPKHKKK